MSTPQVSDIFDQSRWERIAGFDFEDLTYHRAVDQGTVRIAFDRPEVRNAFRPNTVDELYRALDHARMSTDIGCVLLTGNGPSPKDGGWAFCSGGDQRIRGKDGYRVHRRRQRRLDGDYVGHHRPREGRAPPHSRVPTLDSLHAQAGGVRCPRLGSRWRALAARDLRHHGGIARARPVQADRYRRRLVRWRVRFGVSSKQVGQKFAREIFFLGDEYTAEQAHSMGMVNRVVDHSELESAALDIAAKINGKSPTANRMAKFAMNLVDDGLVGQQVFAGEATRLAYMTDEAEEGRDAFLEKRSPDWEKFPYHF